MEAVPLDQAMNPARHLADLFENYDYVLIDCPPSLGRKLVAALVMSTHVACPVKLSGFAVDGVEGLLNYDHWCARGVQPRLGDSGYCDQRHGPLCQS